MYDAQAFERKKYGLLSFVFGLIIGTYWLFRPIKDAVFFTMVGKFYQPKAKMLSVFFVGLCVLVYSKLVDRYPRHKLLLGFTLFYVIGTAIFAFLIWHPEIGICNITASPDRLLGWSWYLFVESFGSIMVALFWSFVSDTTTPEIAKRRYFTVAIGGQTGGFLAPLVAQQVTYHCGTGPALLIPVSMLTALLGLVYYYMKNITPEDEKLPHVIDYRKKPLEGRPKKTGFLEGARLLFTRPYLFGILTIVTFYEIVTIILDYHFKVLASTEYTGDALTNYLYGYALWTNGVALICLISGAGAIGRKLGLTRTLLLLPILVAVAVITFYMHPILQIAFTIMVTCKGLNYALIQPSKEQLYIPTSRESKYKAKAWIDMFGYRTAKGLGAAINNCKEALGESLFVSMTVFMSLGLIGIWIVAAYLVGNIHRQAVKEKRLVC